MKKIPQTYEECDEDEKFIIDKLREFNNLRRFRMTLPTLFYVVDYRYRHLINITFKDNIRKDSKGNKQLIIEFIKKYKRRPKNTKTSGQVECRLGGLLNNYISELRSSFDINFKNEIDALCSKEEFNRQEIQKNESFKKMMNMIPIDVKFKEGQTWKGVDYKYTFICTQFGEFERRASSAQRCWKKGQSGHQKIGRIICGKKNSSLKKGTPAKNKIRVKNIQTEEIFSSMTEAAQSVRLSISNIGIACKKIQNVADSIGNMSIKGDKNESF